DAAHAPGLGDDAAHRAVGVDARAGAVGGRDVGDQHALLGVERTAEQAEARLGALLAVVVGDEAAVAELLAALADLVVERVDLVGPDRLDLEHALDALEGRQQIAGRQVAHAVFAPPLVEDRLRGAEAVAQIVHRRAADVAPL